MKIKLLLIMCIAVILIAGCTGTQVKSPTPTPTPTPTMAPNEKAYWKMMGDLVVVGDDFDDILSMIEDAPAESMTNSYKLWLINLGEKIGYLQDDNKDLQASVIAYEAFLIKGSTKYQTIEDIEDSRQKINASTKDIVLAYNILVDIYNNKYGAEYGIVQKI